MNKRIGRPRWTSYAFADNRHQRPMGTLLFPTKKKQRQQSLAVMRPFRMAVGSVWPDTSK